MSPFLDTIREIVESSPKDETLVILRKAYRLMGKRISGARYREANRESERERNKVWRKNNPEKVNEKNRAYYGANPERVREANKKWREGNSEKVGAIQKAWREANRERYNTCKKAWRESHQEKQKAISSRSGHKRRARCKNTEATLTAEQWQKIQDQQNNRCLACGRKFGPRLKPTKDHIIALTRGGGLTMENIQALCQSCNSKKLAKLDRANIITWLAGGGELW